MLQQNPLINFYHNNWLVCMCQICYLCLLESFWSIDNYLLQVLGWALTEYGDSLQSLVNTPSLNNKFIQCTFFRE